MLSRTGDAGYVTWSDDHWNLSPVYVVTAAATRLIKNGHTVQLPQDYTTDVLDQITWLTGTYGRRVDVSFRQGNEVAEIARTLRDDHSGSITPAELDAINTILTIVTGQQ